MPTMHQVQEEVRTWGSHARAVAPPRANHDWSWWQHHCFLPSGLNTHPVCGEIDSHVRPLQAAALQGLSVISKQGPCNDFPEGFRSPREFQT